jgi:hypothetical protein
MNKEIDKENKDKEKLKDKENKIDKEIKENKMIVNYHKATLVKYI